MMPLERFLRMTGDVQAWWESLQFQARQVSSTTEEAAKLAKKEEKKSNQQKWESDHLEMFREFNIDWPLAIREHDAKLARIVAFMTQCQQDKCLLMQLRYADEPEDTVHDLTPAAMWDCCAVAQSPCICSISVLWMRKNCRLMHGSELLALQGFPASALKHTYEHDKLSSLAGNAFCAFHVLPMVIAMFSLYPFGDMPFEEGFLGDNVISEMVPPADSTADLPDAEEESESEDIDGESAKEA